MSGEQIVIQTMGLSKQYQGVTALRGLNLQVAQHSIFGFLGPNGSGKTTTIKLLLGLTRPTSGTASIFGCDTVRDTVAVRQRIGYLAQDPSYYKHMTARETMRFSARFFYKGPKDSIEARIEETLALVGLADKADRPIKGFSGGERQRLGIAQAQVNYPDLLILDEPAAALDPMGRRDVLEVMSRLRKHTTIFYSTHILDDVQRVSDSVAILNHGQLVAQAPIEQLLAGSGGLVYSLTVRGEGLTAQQALQGQPWVTAVTRHPDNGNATLQIGVSDEEMAESQLLRLVLADKQTMVTAFGRKKYDLEEIFMQMVDGGH
jgi:ABC-2 type transport system ATP-binding protein